MQLQCESDMDKKCIRNDESYITNVFMTQIKQQKWLFVGCEIINPLQHIFIYKTGPVI